MHRDDLDAFKCEYFLHSEVNLPTVHRNDCNLLHFAVSCNSNKILGYLLSLNCFDLEKTDKEGATALTMTLKQSHTESLAVQLIKAGAETDKVTDASNNTYLHLAMLKRHFEAAKVLIQHGTNLNAQNEHGDTPLHDALQPYIFNNVTRAGVDLLLDHGADTTIKNNNGNVPFDYAVINKHELSLLWHLFYCTFDSHSNYVLPMRVLFELMRSDSPLLQDVMEMATDVIYDDDDGSFDFQKVNFFTIKSDFLELMIKKFSWMIRKVLLCLQPYIHHPDYPLNINNWELLLQSELRSETIEFIGKVYIILILRHGKSEEKLQSLTDLIFYLLSYGLNIWNDDYEYVYEALGYCDLFKTILNMDVTDDLEVYGRDSMLSIIVNMRYDLNTFVPVRNFIPFCHIEPLLDYFADPGLRELCEVVTDHAGIVDKFKKLPKVALLLQLARDATRKHIIHRFNINRTSQYYALLKMLPIPIEKILSFETKLYG